MQTQTQLERQIIDAAVAYVDCCEYTQRRTPTKMNPDDMDALLEAERLLIAKCKAYGQEFLRMRYSNAQM